MAGIIVDECIFSRVMGSMTSSHLIMIPFSDLMALKPHEKDLR